MKHKQHTTSRRLHPICSDTRWAIIGNCGLYVGQWLRRKDAIQEHCKALGKFWPYCRRKGDRVVKVQISWPNAPHQATASK